MKLIHLSDLHIGKRVNEFSMTEDQKYILDQIFKIIMEEKPEAVILAGDLYDKPVPPAEAVQVLDEFLTKLAEERIQVFAVSGNHDSPERLAFGARFMGRGGVHISPVYDGKTEKFCLEDEYGRVWIHLLPFLKPAAVRHAFPNEEIHSYEEAIKTALSHMELEEGDRHVLAAHQFVAGGSRCESEEIAVGGVDQVDFHVFDSFDYVALGHLHSPQQVGRKTLCYCGSPLKYSFSEADQEKSLTVVELFEKGKTAVRRIPLAPLRDMRKIRGSYNEVMSREFYEKIGREDYVHITLTDENDIPDGIQRLRVVYPNLMTLEYDNRRTRESRQIDRAEEEREKSELELFEEFFKLQNNQPMSWEQKAFSEMLIKELKEERERQ